MSERTLLPPPERCNLLIQCKFSAANLVLRGSQWGEASLACVLAAEAYYDARKALQQDDIVRKHLSFTDIRLLSRVRFRLQAASALDMICEDLQARSRYYQGRSRAPVVSQGRIDVSVAKLARKPEQDGKEAVSQFAIAASAAGAAARDLVASTMGDIPSLRKALLEEAMPPPPALNAAREVRDLTSRKVVLMCCSRSPCCAGDIRVIITQFGCCDCAAVGRRSASCSRKCGTGASTFYVSSPFA